MRRIFLALVALVTLAACGAVSIWSTDEAVHKAAYVHDGPTMLTLFTVISNRSGAGAHLSLMVNGSQRVLFDPAGTWQHPHIPERNDLHYGITENVVDFYIDYHSRITHYTVRQDLVVSPEVAEQAIRLMAGYGAVPQAFCSSSITDILSQLPGFESFSRSLFPKKAMEAFSEIPGVTYEEFYDDDPEENGYILTRGI